MQLILKKSIRKLQFNIYSRKIPVLREDFLKINVTKYILLKQTNTYTIPKYTRKVKNTYNIRFTDKCY